MTKGYLIVVALGGNAISLPDEEGTVDRQFHHSRQAARPLADLIDKGHHLVITHGNGPQIGNFLLRNHAAAETIYPLPMEVAVAHVQGGMGFMIAQTLTNELASRGHDQMVTALVTTVLVDQNDPSFTNPTKPVGRVLPQMEADHYVQTEGWTMKEVAPGRFRRVVASPQPLEIMEIEAIRRAVREGDLLVACGGGGVPVIRKDGHGSLHGVRAVIDKDLASALLASQIDADAMLILTNISRVCIDNGKPDQREIDRMSLTQAREWLAEGQFPPGSMGPKVRAAIRFLETSSKHDARVLIGPLERAGEAVAGTTGTCITRDDHS